MPKRPEIFATELSWIQMPALKDLLSDDILNFFTKIGLRKMNPYEYMIIENCFPLISTVSFNLLFQGVSCS